MRKYTLQPKTIERLFNELLECASIRITEAERIPAAKGGTYCFFWTGSINKLVNAALEVPSPKGCPKIVVEFNRGWLTNVKRLGIPLYTGSSTKLRNRLRQHHAPRKGRVNPRSTTTQVRRALQKIFTKKGEAKRVFERNVVVRYALEENPIARFYLEHKVIGKLMPLFNVKPER